MWHRVVLCAVSYFLSIFLKGFPFSELELLLFPFMDGGSGYGGETDTLHHLGLLKEKEKREGRTNAVAFTRKRKEKGKGGEGRIPIIANYTLSSSSILPHHFHSAHREKTAFYSIHKWRKAFPPPLYCHKKPS